MHFVFEEVPPLNDLPPDMWSNWRWQLRKSLKSEKDYSNFFSLSEDEQEAFQKGQELFQIRTTPYYAQIAKNSLAIRKILMPTSKELYDPVQALADPLGENSNRPEKRIIHRYSDRVLFLVTDFCSVYCRYCTRKHFTATNQAFPAADEYTAALNYIKRHPGIREVILSGGDPLTLSDDALEQVVKDLRDIDHVEVIRIGTRMPVVCPMRVTENLCRRLQKYHPVYIMTHFNHPEEVTLEAAKSLELLANHGFPLFNQMVLLNGVNNHPAVVQALSRRLLYLRTKPYYAFQCDPSIGTDHLRTSVEQSKEIVNELWGHLSGLATPQFSLDLPGGGGKVSLSPDASERKEEHGWSYRGWDGLESEYKNPEKSVSELPESIEPYVAEWKKLKSAKFPPESIGAMASKHDEIESLL